MAELQHGIRQLGKRAREGLQNVSEHATVDETKKPPYPTTPVNDLQTGPLSYLSQLSVSWKPNGPAS
ncbi:hypothetical protein TSUD_313320 [Trifolium subterraneum]|uniref:Uncharacterized protein n=1 Tax=Trifolium subterraneum TaxID=3900 RepID=A0A2Z6MDV9_TRISU|nr:hypothetical protein TSUD_313320 [Trifolium subterraneum]